MSAENTFLIRIEGNEFCCDTPWEATELVSLLRGKINKSNEIAIRFGTLCKCNRCGYLWMSNLKLGKTPKSCASKHCHSPYWNEVW